MEGTDEQSHKIMESLEQALKDVSGLRKHLNERLGPAIAALMHTADFADLGPYRKIKFKKLCYKTLKCCLFPLVCFF